MRRVTLPVVTFCGLRLALCRTMLHFPTHRHSFFALPSLRWSYGDTCHSGRFPAVYLEWCATTWRVRLTDTLVWCVCVSTFRFGTGWRGFSPGALSTPRAGRRQGKFFGFSQATHIWPQEEEAASVRHRRRLSDVQTSFRFGLVSSLPHFFFLSLYIISLFSSSSSLRR